MVKPIVSENKEITKKIVGDGKTVMMRSNSDSLIVIGSGNIINVDNNEGVIKIVGDGCRLSVGAGNGSIEYNGDGGYLETGRNINIKYKGDGGKIVQMQNRKVLSCEEINIKKRSKKEKNVFVCNLSSSQISPTNTVIDIPFIKTTNIGIVVKKRTKC